MLVYGPEVHPETNLFNSTDFRAPSVDLSLSAAGIRGVEKRRRTRRRLKIVSRPTRVSREMFRKGLVSAFSEKRVGIRESRYGKAHRSAYPSLKQRSMLFRIDHNAKFLLNLDGEEGASRNDP